jgi:hypothetical protein
MPGKHHAMKANRQSIVWSSRESRLHLCQSTVGRYNPPPTETHWGSGMGGDPTVGVLHLNIIFPIASLPREFLPRHLPTRTLHTLPPATLNTSSISYSCIVFLYPSNSMLPLTGTARSEAWTVFARSNIWIVDSNPIRGMNVWVYSVCWQRPCDGLIPRPRRPTDCI